jgi:thioredoxin
MAGNNVVTVTESNFENEVLQSKVPVLVDFWATWCGPCRAIAPLVEQLGTEYAGRAKVAKVDVDANQRLAGQFGISSIPTLMVFKDGRVVEQILGARPKPALAALLDKHM